MKRKVICPHCGFANVIERDGNWGCGKCSRINITLTPEDKDIIVEDIQLCYTDFEPLDEVPEMEQDEETK